MQTIALFIAVYHTIRTSVRSTDRQAAFLEDGFMEFVHDQFQYNASDHRSYGMINTPPPLIDIDAQNDVFYSLQGMMQNVQSTFESVHEWITYVAECVDSGDCLVIDLCLNIRDSSDATIRVNWCGYICTKGD